MPIEQDAPEVERSAVGPLAGLMEIRTGAADGGHWASVSRLDLDPDTAASQKPIVNPIKTRIVSHQSPIETDCARPDQGRSWGQVAATTRGAGITAGSTTTARRHLAGAEHPGPARRGSGGACRCGDRSSPGRRLPLLALMPQWRQDYPNKRPPTWATAISEMGQEPPPALQKRSGDLPPRP
jgi:hypothetical protein